MIRKSETCFSGPLRQASGEASRQAKKGSVLIFTLFIMMITLIIGISLMATSLSGRRSTLSSGKSVNAFQIADSGLEATLVRVKNTINPATDTLDDIFDTCSNSDDKFEGTNISGGEYSVTFWDDADPIGQLECDSAFISDIIKIKSVGTYSGATRSVEASLVP
jgi:type IV pilus assembly PilX-like protein